MEINLDLYQTVAVSILVLFVGGLIGKKNSFLRKYCIPAPVIGGMVFALLTLFVNQTFRITVNTDDTMRDVFMTLFFTSVGYTASLKLLKKGGKQVAIFTLIAAILVICQDLLGVGLAKIFNLDPLLGLCTGSISMVGGHRTAGSFGTLLENNFGIEKASAVGFASATFGLIMGGLTGGPVAERLITKNNLSSTSTNNEDDEDDFPNEKHDSLPSAEEFFKAFAMLFVAAGIGTIISGLIEKTGVTFPSYIGAMLAAAILRNLSDTTKKYSVMLDIVNILGYVSLSIFLSLSLMSLKLWQLADLALPMLIMLIMQAILVVLIAYFVVFRLMGKDYEAAVMASATCGFGMGATPNAIANIQTITDKKGPAPRAFFIVPLVGSFFIDFINGLILTIFINVVR